MCPTAEHCCNRDLYRAIKSLLFTVQLPSFETLAEIEEYAPLCASSSNLPEATRLSPSFLSSPPCRLDHQPLNLILQRPYLPHQITRLIRRNAAADNRARDAAGAPQRHLARDVDVGRVLVLAEEREVQEDGEGCRVGGQDDDLGDAAVERFGCWEEGVLAQGCC